MSARSAPPSRATASGPPPLVLILSVVLVGSLIVGLAVYFVFFNSDEEPLVAEGSANVAAEGGGVVVSEGDDVPEVHVYVDYQCPYCAYLEYTSGADILEAAEQGRIALTITTMSFLDSGGNDSSARTANAAVCADDQGAFADFFPLPFGWSTEELEAGAHVTWTDEELIGFGETAGVADLEAFRGCVEDGEFRDYVADMQERASRDGISGSPRVLVDGEEVSEEELTLLMYQPGSVDQVLGLQ